MKMEKKVNYVVSGLAEQREYPNKSSKSKVSSKSELRKVKQDNNLSSAHNVSSIGKILGAQNCGDLQKSQIAAFFYQILTKICEVLQN